MIYVAPWYVWFIFAAILTYLGTVVYLWHYLRYHDPKTWEWLGSPILTQPKITAIQTSLYTLWFVFSRRYLTLGDYYVSRLVWTIRAEILFIAAMVLVGRTYGLL